MALGYPPAWERRETWPRGHKEAESRCGFESIVGYRPPVLWGPLPPEEARQGIPGTRHLLMVPRQQLSLGRSGYRGPGTELVPDLQSVMSPSCSSCFGPAQPTEWRTCTRPLPRSGPSSPKSPPTPHKSRLLRNQVPKDLGEPTHSILEMHIHLPYTCMHMPLMGPQFHPHTCRVHVHIISQELACASAQAHIQSWELNSTWSTHVPSPGNTGPHNIAMPPGTRNTDTLTVGAVEMALCRRQRPRDPHHTQPISLAVHGPRSR